MAYLDKVKLADYTRKEDWLNSISHMVGGGLSVVALLMCCIKSIILRRWDYLLLSFIYGITMIAMYSCSSVYHALRPNNGKKVMRMIDHSMIYPMIAGTITPFALLVIKPVKPVLGWVIFAVAWVVVATMIPLTLTIFEKTKGIDVVMYLALGWLIIISIKNPVGGFQQNRSYTLDFRRNSIYTRSHSLRHRQQKALFSHGFSFLYNNRLCSSLSRCIYVCACISGQEANRKAKSSGKGKVLAARLFIFLQCRILC